MTAGGFLIWFAASMCAVAWVAALRWARGHVAAERTLRRAYHAMTLALVGSSCLLMRAILAHDFRLDYVVGYSSRDLPLVYLISAFWAGQQGTFLLWALVGALVGYALFRQGAWERAAVIAAYLPTVGFLLVLMLSADGNPFRLAAVVPADGRGLNALLQDPWMASHPPAIFVGYVALAVPAALALAALFRRKEDEWVAVALPWGLAAFISLGVGIVLGGFWAYKVLGWGGFWGWDPVENASLIPWIAVAALVHGLLVQRHVGALRRTNLALALGGYVLILYATFLTRSGVLADFSVHSFPAGSIYGQLVTIMVVTIGVSVFAFLRARHGRTHVIPLRLGWPLILSATVLLLVLSGTLVAIATSWPLLSSAVGQPAAIPVSFYNAANLPLYIGLLSLLSVAPFLSWGAHAPPHWWRQLVVPGGLAAIACCIAVGQGVEPSRHLALFYVAVFAVLSNGLRLVQVARGRLLQTGAALAHIGLAVMFIGIVGSTVWGEEQELYLPLGQPVEALGSLLTYRGHIDGSAPQHRWGVGIRQPGGVETLYEVTMHATGSGPEAQQTRKPAIVRSFIRDLYLAPAAVQNLGPSGERVTLSRGEPVVVDGATLTFLEFSRPENSDELTMMVQAAVRVESAGQQETIQLPLRVTAEGIKGDRVAISEWPGTTLKIERMAVEAGLIEVFLGRGSDTGAQALVLNASTEPLVNLVWLGTLLLGAGCGVAMVRRVVELRVSSRQPARHRSLATGNRAVA